MTYKIKMMIGILTLCFAVTASAFTPPEKKSPETDAKDKDYVFQLYRATRDNNGKDKNVAVSPYGVSVLGEMLNAGAESSTRKTLQELFLTPNRTDWLLLPKDGELPFVSANGIWVRKGYSIRQSYLETLQTLLNSEVAEADFDKNAVQECLKINTWVSDKTQGQITHLLDSLDPQARLVLVNALSFQGQWAVPFDEKLTKETDFHVSKDKTEKIRMMQNTYRINYIKTDTFQSAILPYRKNLCSMVIVLPNEDQTLDAVEQNLNEETLNALTGNMEMNLLRCEIPAFEIVSDIDLKTVLKNIGLGIVFDAQKADFDGISEEEGLFVSEMIQKVRLQVNESGTVAAAGSGAVVQPKSIQTGNNKPIPFRADRPFLFILRDNTTGTPLFTGRFVSP
jgi:serpin B